MASNRRSPNRRETPKIAAAATAYEQRTATVEVKNRQGRQTAFRFRIVMIVSVVALGASAVYIYQQYRVSRLAQLVRSSFAARNYENAASL